MLKPGRMVDILNGGVFSLQMVVHNKCAPGWSRPPRQHRFHSIFLICKGRGEFVVNGSPRSAEPGKLFTLVPGTVCERKSSHDDPLEYYSIRFSAAHTMERDGSWQFSQAFDNDFPFPGEHKLSNAPVVINLLEQMHFLWQRRGSMVAMRRKILFYELLLAIARDFREQAVTGHTTAAIERTIEYMVNHYKEAITLEQLAVMAGLSPSHYSRLFKRYTSHSPIDYLVHVRMDRAKELLLLSDYRLKAVARSVGYQDEYYFSRLFKKITGIAPSEYADISAGQIAEVQLE